MITLDDVRRAAGRIDGRLRRTPLIGIDPMRGRPAPQSRLVLKLESLQVTGSFKARGRDQQADEPLSGGNPARHRDRVGGQSR
jgi:threonine dehydratase